MPATLDTYIDRTRRLLQVPAAPNALYPNADLVDFINQARGQVAGEGECIRQMGSFQTAANTRVYNYNAITLSPNVSQGLVAGVIHVRSLRYVVGDGYQWVTPRAWEWFNVYHLNNVVPPTGVPSTWAQFQQGALGSLYVDPVPDGVYTMQADCVCYPTDLSADSQVEAIPYLWTDAVPFFAAFLACLSAQSGQRQADADRHFTRYSAFIERARQFANPSVNRTQYEQAKEPAAMNRYGMQQRSPTAGAAG